MDKYNEARILAEDFINWSNSPTEDSFDRVERFDNTYSVALLDLDGRKSVIIEDNMKDLAERLNRMADLRAETISTETSYADAQRLISEYC